MELGKMAAAALAVLSIAVAVFQIYSYVALVISGQMVIRGAENWIMAFVYQLSLPAYIAWMAFYIAYPEKVGMWWTHPDDRVIWNDQAGGFTFKKAGTWWANLAGYLVFIGMVIFGLGAFIGAISLSVMIWSVFYTLIVSWIVKLFMPGINQSQLVGWVFFFFVAEIFYIIGRMVLLSDYVLKTLKATISEEIGEAKSMFGRAVAFLVAASLVTSLAKAAITLLYLSWLFGNLAQFDFVKSLPTALVAFMFTVVPVTAAFMMLSWLYKATKDWLSRHMIRG